MAIEFDYLTLSAYVDGELDRQTMQDVESFLDSDAQARRFVLDAMRTTVLLRAGSNEALHEPVPERLRQVLVRPAGMPSFWREIRFPALKLATALALVVIGVGLGFFYKPGTESTPQQPFHLLPTAYQQVINQSLENHMSGDPLSLDLGKGGQRIVITPIKTYRNRKDGHYYRGYYLELVSNDARQRFKGMAYRIKQSEWRTTALFMPKT
jgi:hypothetical protein